MLKIDVTTQAAQKAADDLNEKIERIGDTADRTGERIRSGLDFGGAIKKEFAALRKELGGQATMLQELRKEFGALSAATLKQGTANESLRTTAAAVSKAVLANTAAIRGQTKTLTDSIGAAKKAAEQEVKTNKERKESHRLLRLLETASSRRLKDNNAIARATANLADSEGKALRIREMLRDSYDKIGTSAEKYLATLRRENQQMHKTQETLAEYRAGWDLLSDKQKDATFREVSIQRALKDTARLLKENLSPLQRYQRDLAALNQLRQEFIHSKGKAGVTEEQYTRALRALDDELMKVVEAENKKRLAQEKSVKAQTYLATEATKYAVSLRQMNNETNKTDEQLARMRAGWDKLSEGQRKATDHQIAIARAFRETSDLLKEQLSPMQQYQRQLANLTKLRQEFERTGGRRGVTEEQYARALRTLDDELLKVVASENKKRLAQEKSVQSTVKNTSALRAYEAQLRKAQKEQERFERTLKGAGFGHFNREAHVGAQTAAAFRAAMHGANLGFGIFTGETIAVATAVYGLTVALRESIQVGAEFERSFERAAILMKSFSEISSGMAGEMTVGVKAVKAQVLDLAETTQYSVIEVSDAAGILAMAGQDAFQIYNNLGSVLDLATVGMMDMSKAADIATGMMSSFSMEGREFERAVDVIAATSAKTKASVEDIGMSMTYIGPIAEQAGSSIEQVSAAIGLLAESNIRGSKAGTALRRMFTNLVSPTKTGMKAFKELGIDIESVVRDGVDLVEVFEMLAAKGADIGHLKAIFGQYALTSAVALQENIAAFKEFQEELETTQGFAAKVRDELQKNLVMAFEELKSVIGRVMVEAFDEFGPGLERDVRDLAEFIRQNTGEIARTIGNVAKGVASTVKFLAENFDILMGVLLAFTSVKVVSATLGLLSNGLLRVSTAAQTFTLAQRNVNVSMAEFGGFNASYVQAVNKKYAALSALPGALTRVQQAQMQLNLAGAKYTQLAPGWAVTTSQLQRSVAGTGAAAVKGAAGIGIFGRAIAGVGAGARGLLGILGGLPGIMLTIASIALPAIIMGFNDASEGVYNFTGALEEFEAFEGRIGEMAERVRHRLQVNLRRDLDEAKRQVEDLRSELANMPERRAAAQDAATIDYTDSMGLVTGDVLSTMANVAKKVYEVTEAKKYLNEASETELRLTEDLTQAQLDLAGLQRGVAVMSEDEAARKREVAGILDDLNTIRTDEGTLLARSTLEYTNYVEKIDDTRSAFEQLRDSIADFLSFFTSGAIGKVMDNLIPESAMNALREFIGLLRSAKEPSRQQSPLGPSWRPGPVAQESDLLDRDSELTDSQAAAALKAQTAELSKYFAEYEKGIGSVAGMKRELAEIEQWQTDIAKKTPAATAALKEQGYTAEQARAALDWKREDLAFEYVSQQLEQLDPRFKDLKDSLLETRTGALTTDAALSKAEQALQALGLSADVTKQFMAKLKPAIEGVGDGSAQLAKDFQKLREEAAVLMAQWSSPATFDAMVKRYESVGGAVTKLTIATHRASALFGNFTDSVSETDKVREAAEVLAVLVENTKESGVSAQLAEDAFRDFYNSTPLGALQEQNRQTAIRIGLMNETAETQAVINMAMEQYGSTLDKMPEGFIDAAREAYRLNEELKRIEEIQGAFRNFGDGVARIFAGLFDGSTRNFKDMTEQFKDLFKQLLAELAFMAAKNVIMVAFSGQGSGGGGGGWLSTLGNVIGGFFGGGNTAGGGSIMNVVSSIGSLTGAGGSTASTNGLTNILSSLGNLGGSGGASNGGLVRNIGNYIGRMFGLGGAGVTTATTGIASSMAPVAGYLGPGSTATYGVMAGQTGVGNGALASSSGGMGGMGAAAGMFAWFAAAILANMSLYDKGWRPQGGELTLPNGETITGGGRGSPFSSLSTTLGAGGMIVSRLAESVLTRLGLSDRWASIISGGALVTRAFGRKAPELTDGETTFGFGGAASGERYRTLERGGWFRSDRRRWHSYGLSDESEDVRSDMEAELSEVVRSAANYLRDEAPGLLSSAIKVVNEYDKKGKITATKYFVELLGRTWEEDSAELAQTRVAAEQIIHTIDSIFARTAEGVTSSATDALVQGIRDANGRLITNEMGELINTSMSDVGDSTRIMGEASQIAERWRDDAEMLMQGAQFLLAAAGDMRRGLSLLGEGSTLTEIADLVESMNRENETLSETYTRLYQSTTLVESAFAGFNITAGRTRAEFVEFSADLVETLGGVDSAREAIANFTAAFSDIESVIEHTAQTARARRSSLLENIGLDPNISAADFAEAFTAALPDLDASEVADWIQAGQGIASVSNALRSMRDQLTGGKSLAEQLEDQINAIRMLGATELELAEARDLANQILAKALGEFMLNIDRDLAGFEGNEYAFAVADINREMNSAIEEATALGASEEELNRIRRRAQYQIDDIAKQLEDFMFGIDGQLAEMAGHPVSHQLKEINRAMEDNIRQARALGGTEVEFARIRRLAAVQTVTAINELKASIRGLVAEFYAPDDEAQNARESMWEAQRQAAEQLYDQEMQRYDDAQEAIKNIAKFLRELEMGELSPGSWQDRLGAGRANFMDVFTRAMAGDQDALSDLTGAAQGYLELASEFFGTTTGYDDVYQFVTSMLRMVQAQLATIERPQAPTGVDGSDSAGGSSSESDRIQREAERFQLALQIAQQIGDLGLALNVSVFDLMEEFGVKLEDLATALGININQLNADTTTSIQILAGALGIGFVEVTEALGIEMTALAAAFGINISAMTVDMLEGLAQFSEIVGMDIVAMADTLGLSMDRFGDLVADSVTNSLATLPDVPSSIVEGIQPFLDAIRQADNTEAINTSIGLLIDWVSSLPEDQSALLRPILQAVGIDVTRGTNSISAEIVAQIQATNEVQNAVGNLQAAATLNLQALGFNINALHGPLGDIAASVMLVVDAVNALHASPIGGGTSEPKNAFFSDPESGTLVGDKAMEISSGLATAEKAVQTSTQAQTDQVVEKLEEIQVALDQKLEQIRVESAKGSSNLTSIKNTTRRQGIANANKSKKGRTK